MTNTEDTQEYDTVILEADGRKKVEFAIIDEFEMEEKTYVLLAEIKDDTILEDPKHMRFMRNDTDSTCEQNAIVLTEIESAELYNQVIDHYISLM